MGERLLVRVGCVGCFGGLVAAFVVALVAGVAASTPPDAAEGASGAPGVPRRIVSLNPSLTEILVALGAQDRLVGVDDFSARQQQAVAHLPRVGGLYNPSLESLVALAPDLVVLVPSAQQRDLRIQLEELGIPRLEVDPLGFDDVLATIVLLGERVGRPAAAARRVQEIRTARSEVEAATRKLERPRVVFVLERDPLFVIGRGSFVDEMLAMAGARNVAAAFDEPYPRVSQEWLVAAAPELILDASPGDAPALEFWRRWPSLPAVRAGRVRMLREERITRPGPFLDRALLDLARAIHGDALQLPGTDAAR